MPDEKVAVERIEGGAVWRLALGGSKGNIVDAALGQALADAFDEAARTPGLKAVLLEGQGKHFSFGASVQEHLPGEVAGMLRRFHALLLQMLDVGVPLLAVVRGTAWAAAWSW
jgi:cyclohexa-1,5-dienecarbonyl-CoA hydratase